MKNEIITVDGSKWLVREAESMDAALDEIAMARVTGSVGGKSTVRDVSIHEWYGKTEGAERVIADVVRLNDDGTERKPYAA